MAPKLQLRPRAPTRRTVLLVLVFYLFASGECLNLGDPHWPNGRHHGGRRLQGPIKTVVVLMMENRSFDHMLGWLRATRPDIDGLTGDESNPLNTSDPSSLHVHVSADAAFVDSDPGHSFQAIREQVFGTADGTSADPPPMNGFVQQAMREGLGMAFTAMSGFAPSQLPVYAALANEFAVFDRWFASAPTSTQPNRLFLHSATSHGLSSNVKENLVAGLPQKTIFESLDADGLSFGIYYQDIPAVLFLRRLRRLKYVHNFHSYKLSFKRHARRGTLPNYAVIEQHYFDSETHPANDDHPSHDVAEGQKLVKEVYETLRASPQWNETALLIVYDEHGGFYDHVPTPVRGVPSPDGVAGPPPFFFDFNRLGVRVPAILVSPWVEKATVIHEPDGPTPTSQFEHSSVPATLKKMFNLSSGFLTDRDAWAGTFEGHLTARKTPRTDCPMKLPEVHHQLRPFGASDGAQRPLSEFQQELMHLASELTGERLVEAFEDVVKEMTSGEAGKYASDAAARFLDAGRAALHAGETATAFVEIREGIIRTVDSILGHGSD